MDTIFLFVEKVGKSGFWRSEDIYSRGGSEGGGRGDEGKMRTDGGTRRRDEEGSLRSDSRPRRFGNIIMGCIVWACTVLTFRNYIKTH